MVSRKKRRRLNAQKRVAAKAKKVVYRKYITSKAWKAKRDKAVKHYGSRCKVCGSRENLQVHHLTYIRLGNEEMKDLMVLCEVCHVDQHFDKLLPIDDFSKEFQDIFRDERHEYLKSLHSLSS